MPRIVHLDGFFDNPEGDFSLENEVLSQVGETVAAPAGEPWGEAAGAEVVLVRALRVGPAEIARLKRCRVLIRYGIGTDSIDLKAAAEAGITVCNVPDFCLDEMADHTMALILALVRGVAFYRHRVEKGEWKLAPEWVMRAPSELRLVTVGFGRIARLVHERAKVFGFERAAYDPGVAPGAIEAEGVKPLGWEEALRSADLLSLHCPLIPATRGLLNAAAFGAMRRGAMLVNTARGPLVELEALCDALREGRIAGAALDVTSPEPLPADHPLLVFPQVVVTPHLAWHSTAASAKLSRKVAEEALRALKGEPLLHPVNRVG
ncbi:MAG TPA: C-terminal binding protein [Chthoniobacteraceae bacterium]|nr:C-terminal binding protein [Chthoniobacteraceae bacterium]